MPIDRRAVLLSTGLLSTAVALDAAAAGPRAETKNPAARPLGGLVPSEELDQTDALQAALNDSARNEEPLVLPAGLFRSGHLKLPSGARLTGAGPRTVIQFTGRGEAFISGQNANGVELEDLTFDGSALAINAHVATGLIDLRDCRDVSLRRITVRQGLLNGITLDRCTGAICDAVITGMSKAGIMSLDAAGMRILHTHVSDCANNGILIWRREPGEDGTLVAQNRIERIAARDGGTGENGNGVNVFRAGSVQVSGNRITDCDYSAIRANAASNIQMIGNSCARLGEVALYAEFAFEGALIANNLVDGAATGVEVTNFNDGGRLAVIQGNLIRNLVRREHEPVDKRGEGITVEADTIVTGNVIEGAPTTGIVIGWGKFLRDVLVTGNLVRDAGVGMSVSGSDGAGACLISQNIISGSREGSIRLMDYDRLMSEDLASASVTNPRLSVSGNLVS